MWLAVSDRRLAAVAVKRISDCVEKGGARIGRTSRAVLESARSVSAVVSRERERRHGATKCSCDWKAACWEEEKVGSMYDAVEGDSGGRGRNTTDGIRSIHYSLRGSAGTIIWCFCSIIA